MHVVIAASLVASESETAPRVRVANPDPAKVDDGCEVLPLLQRGAGDAVALESSRTVRSSIAAVISTASLGTTRV